MVKSERTLLSNVMSIDPDQIQEQSGKCCQVLQVRPLSSVLKLDYADGIRSGLTSPTHKAISRGTINILYLLAALAMVKFKVLIIGGGK